VNVEGIYDTQSKAEQTASGATLEFTVTVYLTQL
jgi:hypothetical protein